MKINFFSKFIILTYHYYRDQTKKSMLEWQKFQKLTENARHMTENKLFICYPLYRQYVADSADE